MSINRYLIAGLKCEMDVRFDMLRERSRKYLYPFSGKPDISLSASDEKIEILRKRYKNLNDAQREYMITSTYFYSALLDFGGYMLHSSAASYNGKAYLFTADSGTGKSTHTRLWMQYLDGVEMINDDKPAVKIVDGRFCAIGTPWSGKTAANSDVTVPVGAVALLRRSGAPYIKPAETSDAVRTLLKQTVIPPRPDGTEKLAVLLDKFIRSVPIFEFGCDISERSLITSFEAMTKETYKRKS